MEQTPYTPAQYQDPGYPSTIYLDTLRSSEVSRLIDTSRIAELKLPYTLRVVGYIRVSTEEQAKDKKQSLPMQEEKIREFVRSRVDWQLLGIYQDIGSGTEAESRLNFQRLLAEARQGKFDVVVAWANDRLGRNFEEMTDIRKQFRQLNVQITTTTEPSEIYDPRTLTTNILPIRKLINAIGDYRSEEDNRSRSERFRLGKEGKAKSGRIPCKVPYGYWKHIVEDNKEGRIEEDIVIPEKAEVVRTIFRLYDIDSMGFKSISIYLNERGIPSPKNRLWCCSSIKYMLQNPSYMGIVRWGWRLAKSKESRARLSQGHEGLLVPGKHERIIEPEQFERVRRKIESRKRLGGRAVASPGLLVGIAKCGRCGSGTYVTQFNHWFAYSKPRNERDKYKKTLAYLCSGYSQYGRVKCSGRYVMAKDKLENLVVERIRSLVNDPEAQEAIVQELKKSDIERLRTELQALQDDLKGLESKRARQKFAYDNGAVPQEVYLEDCRRARNEEEKLKEDITNKQAEIDRAVERQHRNETVTLALDNFDRIWDHADIAKKKELLQSILKRVVVNKDSVEIEFITEER
jgi:site-specific DNA recombinase